MKRGLPAVFRVVGRSIPGLSNAEYVGKQADAAE